MDDLLFLKRLDNTHWLGLRMPPDLKIIAGTDNKGVLEKPWTLGAPPNLEWADAVYYGPAAVTKDVPGKVPGEVVKIVSLTWAEKPSEQFTGPPFKGVLDDVDSLEVSDADKEEARKQLTQVRESVSLPLRVYRAYVQIQESTPRSLENWRDVVLAALSDRPGQLPIEAFGGLLFLVEAETAPPQTNGIFIDRVDPSEAKPGELRVKAFQHSKGVAFECANPVDSKAYTNSSVLKAVDSKDGYSGYYRITRTLGIVERPSRRSTLVAIPTKVEDAPEWQQPAGGIPDKKKWEERRFRLADSLAPDELIGELLNYRIEFFNPHGRLVRVGRVMLQRQRLDPPAALTRAMARLVAKADGNNATLTIRFDLPPTEKQKPDGMDLDLVVYRLESPVLPTGFYGDADDAAVQVARLLSDIDPASVMDVRAGDQVLTGASSESAQANLSNHGLEPFASFLLKPPKPAPVDVSIPAPSEKEPNPHQLPKPDSDDDSPWSQYGWEVGVEQLNELFPPGKAVRLMLALRRVVSPNTAGVVFDGPVPESPVLAPQMLIGFEATSTERDQVVPHFERFWEPRVALELLGADRVYFSEADTPSEPPPSEADYPDDRARVRMQVQHLPGATTDSEPIGGYRVWMRDLPARYAQGYPFEALAVVQAVPQLVKAYAPIEIGRQWWVQVVPDAPVVANAKPKEAFLSSPSPHGMVRGKEDEITSEGVAKPPDQLFKDVADQLEEILDSKASKHDVRGGALLLKFWRMLDPDDCQEVILSISQRRELTRDGAQKWLENKEGHWILFCDQNGGYLGRAWNFSGVHATKVKRVHVLHEVPNTEDTVAVDDFGQMTWNWAGLQDTWHHELEWVVEPLSRYAPLRQRASSPPVSKSGERPKVEPRHLVPRGQLGLANNSVPEANVHRQAILRRMPFAGRVGLIPLPDAKEDAFVWQVNLPPEFRRATHNTHARTALGVLRVEVIEASAQTLLAADFENTAVVDLLIRKWCMKQLPDTAPALTTLDSLEEGHQLVIHQPACFQVALKVRPRADAMPGVSTPPEPQAGETSILQSVERVPKTFSNAEVINIDRCFTHENDQELVVPVARLGWSYHGPAHPTAADVIGRGITTDLSTPEDTSANRAMPGLRLPDPAASVTVFIRESDGVLRPCAYFFGPAAYRDQQPPLPAGWMKDEPPGNVKWGVAYRDNAVVTNLLLSNGGAHAGDLVLVLNYKVASRLRVLWKRGGVALELPPPTPL